MSGDRQLFFSYGIFKDPQRGMRGVDDQALTIGRAVLLDHALRSGVFPRTIKFAPGRLVDGTVYALREEAWPVLDNIERSYYRFLLPVWLLDERRSVEAWVYEMFPDILRRYTSWM